MYDLLNVNEGRGQGESSLVYMWLFILMTVDNRETEQILEGLSPSPDAYRMDHVKYLDHF